MLPGLDTPGYLGLISGCMFSGKTSKLIELYKQYALCNVPISVINHVGDNRYSTKDLSTHDGRRIPCLRSASLGDLENNDSVRAARVVLINEGQFFEDIVPWVTARVEDEGKIVFVCGLDGDFARQSFGPWLDLIPLADEVVKLTALCSSCKRHPGIFSLRLTSNTDQVLIGSSQYAPACRRCYQAADTAHDRSRFLSKLSRERLSQKIIANRWILAKRQETYIGAPKNERSVVRAELRHLDDEIGNDVVELRRLRAVSH